MRVPLFSRLALDSSMFDVTCSQAVSIQGNNAAQWSAVVFALTANNVAFQLQVSNDLENWSDIDTSQTATSIGHTLFTPKTSITAAYVRLMIMLTTAGKAVLAVDLNVAPL